MNTLVIYSISLCLILALIIIIFYLLIKSIISFKHLYSVMAGMFLVGLIGVMLSCSNKIINSLNCKKEFNISNGIQSQIDDSYNQISDVCLYRYLIAIRVPHPKIIFSQAKLESSNYTSNLFLSTHNLFGMKKSESRTKLVSGDNGIYSSYNDWKMSVVDYVLWLYTFNGDKLTQDEYINLLGKVYAEDPKYKEKLTQIFKNTDFKKLE